MSQISRVGNVSNVCSGGGFGNVHSRVSACNYKEDLEKISETDWILEAVVERLDIKEKGYSNLLPFLKETAIVTSNTSGIPLSDLTENLPTNVKERFMITHFFNPLYLNS